MKSTSNTSALKIFLLALCLVLAAFFGGAALADDRSPSPSPSCGPGTNDQDCDGATGDCGGVVNNDCDGNNDDIDDHDPDVQTLADWGRENL